MEIWESVKENDIVKKVIAYFEKYTNTQPVLDILKSPKAFQKVISIILRIFTVVFGLILFVLWIRSWRFINQFKFFGGLGYLIWQLFFIFAAVYIIKIMYQRFVEITDLPESDYIITPIIALLLVTFGEVVFIFLAIMSVPAMLAVWLAGTSLYYTGGTLGMILSSMNAVNPQNIFLAGISVFVTSWVVGFLILIFARLFVETTLALVTIAKEASTLRRHIISED
ncbi:MAG: hypothetical protein R6U57_13895 [Anaerolineales bacterium]